MKTHLTIKSLFLTGLFIFAILVSSLAQSSEFTVPLSDPAKRGKLKAHINSGSITVKGTARKDILIKYTSGDDNSDNDNDDGKHKKDGFRVQTKTKVKVNTNHNDDENEEETSLDGLKKVSSGGVDLEAVESENVVKISSNSWNGDLDLYVEVPTGMDLQLSTHTNGELTVSNIQGSLELTNYNDEITALNISGSVVATTYNGGIKVTFDKVNEGTPMSFTTYNGDIETVFPAAVKNSFKVKTEQGDVYSNFDIDFKSTGPIQKQDAKAGVYKVVVDEWKRGDVNGGGAEVVMRTYNGNIVIRKK